MEMRRAGNSGLMLSRLGLGTMTWGRDTDEHEAADQCRAFIDAGGNFIDKEQIIVYFLDYYYLILILIHEM